MIQIQLIQDANGYTFSTSQTIRESIREIFPDATPIRSVSISYEENSDFGHFAANINLLKQVLLALLGVSNEDYVTRIDIIQFIDPQTGNIIDEINPE